MPNDSNQNSYPITGYQAHHIKDVSVYYKLSLHVTILELNIPQTATITIEVHDNEQKKSPDPHNTEHIQTTKKET